MADFADIGAERAQTELDGILATRTRPQPIIGSGRCLYCDDEFHTDDSLRHTRRWCDTTCRDEYLKRNPEPRAKALPREVVLLRTPTANGSGLGAGSGHNPDVNLAYLRGDI